jgi:hypothetical protein
MKSEQRVSLASVLPELMQRKIIRKTRKYLINPKLKAPVWAVKRENTGFIPLKNGKSIWMLKCLLALPEDAAGLIPEGVICPLPLHPDIGQSKVFWTFAVQAGFITLCALSRTPLHSPAFSAACSSRHFGFASPSQAAQAVPAPPKMRAAAGLVFYFVLIEVDFGT